MMKQKQPGSLLWLAAALILAALCTVVRFWQVRTGFEGPFHLPIPGAPSTVLMWILYILSAAVLLFLVYKQKVDPSLRKDPDLAAFAGEDTLFLGAMVVAAFLTLVAAPLLFLEGRDMWATYQNASMYSDKIPAGNNGILVIATGATSALSFIALLVVAKASFRNTKKGRLGVLLPVINNCLWLMEIYRINAPDPIRWNYVPLLLAIVFGILFYLDWAALYAGVFAPRRVLWTGGMTIVFSGTALAGYWTLSSALLLAAQCIAAFALLWMVPTNLRYPPEPVIEEAPAVEEKLEEDTHE